jgi:hypothetical protein
MAIEHELCRLTTRIMRFQPSWRIFRRGTIHLLVTREAVPRIPPAPLRQRRHQPRVETLHATGVNENH